MSKTLLFFIHFCAVSMAFDHSYKNWDSILKENVKVQGAASRVSYKAVKTNPEKINQFLADVSAVKRSDFDSWSNDQKLAFLINSYNAFTIKLIVDNYPVKSIKDVGSLFTSAWKKKFFNLFQEEQNLDGIEHEMIRKMFQEPRIHFAVVCASKGCPALKNEAFLAEKLETQLESGAKSFLSDVTRNRFDSEKNELNLSMIFKWYGDAFKKKYGTVQNFIAEKLGKTPQESTAIKGASISFLDYDWTLNEAE